MGEGQFSIAYYERNLEELSPELLRGCVELLKERLTDAEKDMIRQAFRIHGPGQWVMNENLHFALGLNVRNLLRQAGFGDEMLPLGNWDHYYTQVIEVALDLRPMPTGNGRMGEARETQ